MEKITECENKDCIYNNPDTGLCDFWGNITINKNGICKIWLNNE